MNDEALVRTFGAEKGVYAHHHSHDHAAKP
jgi:hypothetical protein